MTVQLHGGQFRVVSFSLPVILPVNHILKRGNNMVQQQQDDGHKIHINLNQNSKLFS